VNHAELNGYSILTNGLEEMRKFNPALAQSALMSAELRDSQIEVLEK
jgi:hypothetical protein